jgi:hypothetical protein
LRGGAGPLRCVAMNEDMPDFRNDPEPPPEERTNHLAYIFLALIVMLIFWYGF